MHTRRYPLHLYSLLGIEVTKLDLVGPHLVSQMLGSKIQYWIINWIMFFVEIQWIFGRSKVKRGRKRVKRGRIHFTGFLKK